MNRTLLSLSVLALNALACADADDVDTSDADLTSANAAFEADLAAVDALIDTCEAEGKCAATEGGELGVRGTSQARSSRRLAGASLCRTLKPLRGFQYPYFYVGSEAIAAAITTVADRGADMVFDLSNLQAAIFHYHSHAISNLVGVEVEAYMGYGFGKKANVLDAWSGTFQTAELTADLPVLKLSAGANIFRSPDNTIWGGAVVAGVGINMLGPLGAIEGTYSKGEWTPWDKATGALGRSLYLVDYRVRTAKALGRNYSYLQFATPKGIAAAMVQRLGLLGAAPAAQVIGLHALRARGITIERACP